MIHTVSNHSPSIWKDKVYNHFGETTHLKKAIEKDLDTRVSTAIHRVIGEEQELTNQALADKMRRYPISVIGGDVLNIGLLGCIGAAAFCTSSTLMNVVTGFSMLGGLLNLAQGVLCFQEGIAAWKSNNKELAVRLISQGVIGLGLGAAMILYSAAQFFAITSVSMFFAANPYVLPLLIFACSLLLLAETVHRLKPVIEGTDLGSKLNLSQLRSIMQKKDPEQRIEAATKWVHAKMKECFMPSGSSEKKIRKKLQEFKAEIGSPASLETFRLFEMILERKEKGEILNQTKKVETNISRWNSMLYLKVLSVVLCAAGFSVGMAAIPAHSSAMDGAQNLAMSVASVVPLYLDVRRPFEREIPIVVAREERAG